MKLEDELRMKKFRNAFHRAGLNILFTGYWIAEKVSVILKPFGISEQQFNVLRILRGQAGKPANLFMIQERMIHKMSNATRLVEKLRRKGYVSRELCENNRRMVEICITDKGLNLLQKLDPAIAKHEAGLFSNLTQKEASILSGLLDKLRG